MSDPDIAILRSVADDYDAAGPQFSTLSALFRRVATKLENAHAPNVPPNRSSAFIGICVIDGDDIPGVPCLSCED